MPHMNKLSTYKTTVRQDDERNSLQVVYHSTMIVEALPDRFILCTGGYRTVTTKRKMNQASVQFNLGYGVIQRAGEWYVTYKGRNYKWEASNNYFVLPR